jgi:amino acid transporter
LKGYEASAHLAEETTNAKVNGPWGMVFNIITTCVVGFVYLLILVLCIPTVKTLTDDASDDNLIGNMVNTPYANSAIGVIVYTVGKPTALALTVLIVIMAYMAGLANMTITARIGW